MFLLWNYQKGFKAKFRPKAKPINFQNQEMKDAIKEDKSKSEEEKPVSNHKPPESTAEKLVKAKKKRKS